MANTRRMNRLEELGRVDAERAHTAKGARNLRKVGGIAKRGKGMAYGHGGHVKSMGKATRGGGIAKR